MSWLRAALGLGYPFLVFAGLQWLSPRWVAALLASLFIARWVTTWRSPSPVDVRRALAPVLLVGLVLLGAAVQDDTRTLLFVPVAVNLALLAAFARTLFQGPPLVETLARLQVPDLPEDEARYCRSVTRLWCGFFIANAAVAAWLALAGSLAAWTLYNGFLAYLLVGLLFAAEFVVRAWRFGRYQGTLVEPLFRKWFRAPPEESAGS